MNQDDVRKVLSQNIKKRRKELGITQSKLAELADISEPYMNDIERCQTWISDKTLAKLACALNLAIHELFISDNKELKNTNKEDIYLLFKKHKKGMLDYLDKSIEELFRDMTKN